MDGVERVMVLGILAVIVAILSFAWSATDESTTPVGALERDSGLGGAAIPLSSNTSVTDPVVLDETDHGEIKERLQANRAAREAQQQELQRQRLAHMQRGAAQPREGQVASGIQPGAVPVAKGGLLPPAKDPAPEEPASFVKPSTQIPLKPEAARNESDEAEADGPGFELYTIADGDTLWSIARRAVGTTGGDTNQMVEDIQALNPALVASSMPIGRTIKLPAASSPTGPRLAAARRAASTPEVTSPFMSRMSDTEGARGAAPAGRVPPDGGRVYVVGEGESLSGIAGTELGDTTRWVEIYQLNRDVIPDPDRIRAGQRLILPAD